MIDASNRTEALSAVRRQSMVEIVLFATTFALAFSVDGNFATVGLGVALAISMFRYRTACRRIEERQVIDALKRHRWN